jgi:hypothetical protein
MQQHIPVEKSLIALSKYGKAYVNCPSRCDMYKDNFESKYIKMLNSLAENNKITEEQNQI